MIISLIIIIYNNSKLIASSANANVPSCFFCMKLYGVS